MDTLDEIEAREYAIKDRAWRYQNVQGEVFRLRRNIERLTPLVTDAEACLKVISEIENLAGHLPGDLEGTLGHIARDQIRGVCLAARRHHTNRRDAKQRELADSLERLPDAEARLAAIESESEHSVSRGL